MGYVGSQLSFLLLRNGEEEERAETVEHLCEYEALTRQTINLLGSALYYSGIVAFNRSILKIP